MNRAILTWTIGLSLQAAMLFAQEADRVDVGRLGTGATVWFVRDAGGEWGDRNRRGSGTAQPTTKAGKAGSLSDRE
jgi:hypothetical protein